MVYTRKDAKRSAKSKWSTSITKMCGVLCAMAVVVSLLSGNLVEISKDVAAWWQGTTAKQQVLLGTSAREDLSMRVSGKTVTVDQAISFLQHQAPDESTKGKAALLPGGAGELVAALRAAADEPQSPPRPALPAPQSPARESRPAAPAAPGAALAAQPAPAPSAAPTWIFCCGQFQECVCGDTVRWGNKDKWMEIKKKGTEELQRVTCSIDKLPDILPGDSGKHCQCLVTPGTPFAQSLNPALVYGAGLSQQGRGGPRLVSSCDILQQGDEAARSGREPWNARQWEAAEPFCSASWATSAKAQGAQAGSRAMELGVLQDLMRAWVDPRFQKNYERFYDSSGWVPRAWVNYYAGPPDGKHTKMTEWLIKSVHKFSSEPIVVFHFGFVTPARWNAEMFPQLILLHAAPIPVNAQRSFNFNKLRAMLMSRIKIGAQLDSDQFVAPGCDAIFQSTERQITQDYPMPILPAHFLDRTPKDLGAYWARYCPDGKCHFQTARWGHAHPTWSFWALPWIGRWLRRNFRDETLPVLKGGRMRPLRITDVPEDEDLLNIATWEEGGTKQWCKYDLPGPSDFNALLGSVGHGVDCHSWGCQDMTADRRFHPNGVAKVFWTAHHAVDPAETKGYVERLEKSAKDLPPPILYHGKFYKDAAAIRKAFPDMTCLL